MQPFSLWRTYTEAGAFKVCNEKDEMLNFMLFGLMPDSYFKFLNITFSK